MRTSLAEYEGSSVGVASEIEGAGVFEGTAGDSETTPISESSATSFENRFDMFHHQQL